jgi:hypothetical protein
MTQLLEDYCQPPHVLYKRRHCIDELLEGDPFSPDGADE